LKPSPRSGSAALRLEALWVEGERDQVTQVGQKERQEEREGRKTDERAKDS
jgi:hypothetical protein